MTSRNLFFKLLKENLKRRIWIIAFGVLAFFFALPVSTAMLLSDADNSSASFWGGYTNLLGRVIGTRSGLVVTVTCIMAVVFAMQGFSYLFSKSKVDLYHSVPIKREKLFGAIFLNGVLIYLVAYVINLVLSLGIILLYGVLSVEIIGMALVGTVIHLVFFFSIYSVVVVAIMLTGNIIVALLGSMVFLFYVPLLNEMLKGYAQDFFANYSWRSNTSTLDRVFSPVVSYFYTVYMGVEILSVLWFLLVGIVLCGVSVWIYRKRPSEAAERSMAFSKIKFPIKTLLIILVSLGGGLIFHGMVNNYGDFWLIFGTMIGLALSQCLIEIIYEYDIKAAGSHIKKIWIPAAAVVAIICIFRFDTFGYDSYLPAKEKLESVSLSDENEWDFPQNYFSRDKNGVYRFCVEEEYKFEQMLLTDFNLVYPLLESAANADIRPQQYSSGDQFIVVKYKLKSGKEKYRNYIISRVEQENLYELFQTDEYKEGAYPALGLPVEEVTDMPFYWMKSTLNTQLDISQKEKEELLSVYKEELSNVDYYNATLYKEQKDSSNYYNNATIAAETDIGVIQISAQEYMEEDRNRYSSSDNLMVLYVYPEFKKTLELINGYIK